MKKINGILIMMLFTAALLCSSCSAILRTEGTGNIVEKTYDYKDFTDVDLSDAVNYEITEDSSYSVVVLASDNNLKYMDIRQNGDTLYIGLTNSLKFGLNNDDIMVKVTMPQMNKLTVSGACEGKASGFNSTEDLQIDISGDSELEANIAAGKCDIEASGSSDITGEITAGDTQMEISGDSELDMTMKTGKTQIVASGVSKIQGTLQAEDCEIHLAGASECRLGGTSGSTEIIASGASEMKSPNLILQNASVTLEGASEADIYTDGTLNVDLSGSSQLTYKGNATMGKIEISGDSEINHK